MLDLTSIGVGALALLAVVAAWWRDRRKQRTEGHQAGLEQAEETARRLDHENAAAIRDRARAVGGVRPKDGDTRGFRD